MIKVALTNLGQYSEGILNYTWLNLPATDEEIKNALLSISVDGVEYEEYFITDYESEVSGLEISEYANLDELNELAEKLTELEEYEIDLVGAVMRTHGTSIKKALEKYEDFSYVCLDIETAMSDDENLAYSYIDSVYGDISYLDRNTLEEYFDFESYGRDLSFDYEIDKESMIAISKY